jgi:hypothetical protein
LIGGHTVYIFSSLVCVLGKGSRSVGSRTVVLWGKRSLSAWPLPKSQRCSADNRRFWSGSRRLCFGNTLHFGEGSQLIIVGK